LLETGSYDLVILDLAFPDGSGSDVLPLLPPGTPVVIFSATEPPKHLSRNAAAVLVKTRASNETILATIREVLGKSAKHADRQRRIA
jgi:DNA-binding NarL/FixJ family response regulator